MALQQFLVPQFIDVETKIIGPITTRQFIIILIDGMILFIYYKLFVFNVFIVLALITSAIFGTIAFLRVNGMPFHYFFLNLVQTFRRPRLRVWGKEDVAAVIKEEKKEKKEEKIVVKELPARKLSSLSLIVNTGGAYREEE